LIRSGSKADLTAAVRMARDFHEAMPMRGLSFSERRAAQMYLAALSTAKVFVLDLDGPRGFLIMEATFYPLGDAILAREVIFWIDPRFRGRWWRDMIRAAEEWARGVGAELAAFSCFCDGRTVKLFERAGYAATEISTMKELKWRSSPD
jgi:GNAT superfamily N-acetyltransferase